MERIVTPRLANQDYICESCKHITKYKHMAKLPDSGGWKTVACPHCGSTNIKRLKTNR